jgi:hypothetical protein
MLIVAGTQDSVIQSCDEFVKKTSAAGASVTYFRIKDYGSLDTKKTLLQH